MAKGDIEKLKFGSFYDSESNNEVIRFTPTDILYHRNYFYQKCFTNDGKKLVLVAELDCNRNYYLTDLVTQTAKQLIKGAGDNTSGGLLSPGDSYLLYVENEKHLQRVDLTILEEVIIYTVPDDWVGYGTWVANTDCTGIVGIEISRTGWTPFDDWKIFLEFYHKNPQCRLITIDLETGNAEVVLDHNIWLGHSTFRPNNSDTITFCHEGPHDLVDARMWMINRDGTNKRKVHERQLGESCTHEFWIPDGSTLAYVSYMKGQQQRYTRKYSPDTDEGSLVMEMPVCSHLMSNHNDILYIGDDSGSPADVKGIHSYKIGNSPWIYIPNSKNKKIHKLVKYDGSWGVRKGDRQVTHPHPSFSPGNKYVLYSCDAEGESVLYIAETSEEILAQQ